MRFIFDIPLPVATPSELQLDSVLYSSNPGLPKAQPWAEISQRFQRFKISAAKNSQILA